MSKDFAKLWARYGTVVILAVLVAAVSVVIPQYFLTGSNAVQILLQSSITILLGLCELFAILTSGIDLSVGSVIALTGMATAMMMTRGVNVPLSILIGGAGLGALLGLLNGTLIARTGIPPFIVTLGNMSIYRGLTLIVSDGRPVYGLPTGFNRWVAGYLGPVPIPVIISLGCAVAVWFLLTRTRFGRNVYAVGGNPRAAWLSGIPVAKTLIACYAISGLLAGIGGVVITARLASADPLAGVGWESQGIAATVIGGTSFFGGEGGVFGTVMGAVIMGVIVNALNLLNIQSYYQQVVTGIVIILAVILNQSLQRRSPASK